MAVPKYVQLPYYFPKRGKTYASTSWIILSTAFKEALGLVLWSIRANRCCILYLRSNIRFWKLSIPRRNQQMRTTHSFTQVNLEGGGNQSVHLPTKPQEQTSTHTPLLSAVSASRSLSVSSNNMREYRSRTSASIRGCSLQFYMRVSDYNNPLVEGAKT